MPYSHTHSRSPQPTAHSQSVREAGPNSPTHSLTHSRTHSLTPSLPPMWPHLIHSPTHTHTHTVTRSRTHALIHCSLRWFVRSIELRCFVASLLRCFVASLLRCFFVASLLLRCFVRLLDGDGVLMLPTSFRWCDSSFDGGGAFFCGGVVSAAVLRLAAI